MKQHTPRVRTVPHAVRMWVVIVVVQGMMVVVAEGMWHTARIIRIGKTEQVSQILPSLFHAHSTDEWHAALKHKKHQYFNLDKKENHIWCKVSQVQVIIRILQNCTNLSKFAATIVWRLLSAKT